MLLKFIDFALKFLTNNENVDTRSLINILVHECDILIEEWVLPGTEFSLVDEIGLHYMDQLCA